jgi:cytochrome c oxidase subunit 2
MGNRRKGFAKTPADGRFLYYLIEIKRIGPGSNGIEMKSQEMVLENFLRSRPFVRYGFMRLLLTILNPSQLVRFCASFPGILAVSSNSWLSWLGLHGKQSTMEVEGPVAREQLRLFYITCWVTFFLFVVVGGVLAYATIKFKARSKEDEHAEPPPQGHGNPLVELALIGGSVLALVIIAVPTLKAILYTYDVPIADKSNAYEVTATGSQWWFKFEYPSEQVPGAGTLVTANELVIPAGRAVHIDLRSLDVMHSFWVPKLAGKVDMIPNRPNFLWLKADQPGYFWGQCAEFCGESHAVMRFRVIALGAAEFNDWVAQQRQPARVVQAPATARFGEAKVQAAALRTFAPNEPGISGAFEVAPLDAWRAKQFPEKDENPGLIQQGRQLFASKTCISCHTIRGVPGALGITGPDLTHVGARSSIAGGLLDNTPEQIRRWIHNPELVKPGNKMWVTGYLVNHIQLTPDDEAGLAAFLESLK